MVKVESGMQGVEIGGMSWQLTPDNELRSGHVLRMTCVEDYSGRSDVPIVDRTTITKLDDGKVHVAFDSERMGSHYGGSYEFHPGALSAIAAFVEGSETPVAMARPEQTLNPALEELNFFQRRVAKRLGKRAVEAYERGDNFGVPVRGGVLGLLRTKHDPEIYAAVEGYFKPRGLRFEVHTDDKNRPRSHNMRFLKIDSPIYSISDSQVYPKVYILG